jgi:hypothetical protein
MIRRWGWRRWLLVGLVVASPCWGPILTIKLYGVLVYCFVWTPEDRAHRGEGLPSDARRWKAVLEATPGPDAVEDTEAVILRFPNGEWIIGYCSDSHALWHRGGTTVVKDSRGQVRVFYGHVCGSKAMEPMLSHKQSLSAAYGYLINDCDYKEQFLDH